MGRDETARGDQIMTSLQTLLGDLKREQENLNNFTKAQTERIYGLHHATTNTASNRVAPEVKATLKLSLHKEGQRLLDETREISARIDGINWQIRAVCGLSIQEISRCCKASNQHLTDVI